MKKLLTLIMTIMMVATASFALPSHNEHPFTIPAIKQWHGDNGTFLITQDCQLEINDPSLDQAVAYLRHSLKLMLAPRTGHSQGIIKLELQTGKKKLAAEAYRLIIKPEEITILASTPQGIMWGIQTMLQFSEASAQLPCGTVDDEPDYHLRGMMMDCARKFMPMDYLHQLVRTMSYYKMNCLQVHLNDNGFRKYYNNNWSETYSAFRMESDFFPTLTSADGSYGKDEFRSFVKWARTLGVEIVPEIDVPAHALAFTKYRPSLRGYAPDHMDITKQATIQFIDSLFIEYMQGDDPVFNGPYVHIGTDEYTNADQDIVESFRALTNHLIELVQSYGKTPVIWGSLSYADGDTPVKVDNVIMDMWSTGYAKVNEMKKQGYKMISIPDGYTYIVPAAGYYYDYLNYRNLYLNWTPAVMGSDPEDKLEEGDPQIEGGMFAVWNDVCGNGISVGDVHHRTFPALQVIAEKTWRARQDYVSAAGAYARWNKARQKLGEGPGVDELGDFEDTYPQLTPNTRLTSDQQIHYQLGYDYKVEFDIEWQEEAEGTCLTVGRRAKFYLKDPISGMMGFSRDGYLYTFPHSCRPGVKEHITIMGTNKSTKLLVDGILIKELNYEQRIAADQKPYNVVRTLVFPLEHTGYFKSKITNFKAHHVQ